MMNKVRAPASAVTAPILEATASEPLPALLLEPGVEPGLPNLSKAEPDGAPSDVVDEPKLSGDEPPVLGVGRVKVGELPG